MSCATRNFYKLTQTHTYLKLINSLILYNLLFKDYKMKILYTLFIWSVNLLPSSPLIKTW